MSCEILSIYNDNFELIGKSDYRTVHKKGFWHQVIHCWIIDSNTKCILYQKRHKSKEFYPNKLDVSVAGHCKANENPIETISREAIEEIGISFDTTQLYKIGIRRDTFTNGKYINREFQNIYLYEFNLNPYQIKIKIDELQYIVLLKPNDVITALQNQESIKGLKYSNKTLEEIEISFREFIPSVDNYNIKIPYLISNYIQGDRNIFYK